MTDSQVKEALVDNYLLIRRLDDGSYLGLNRLMMTTAIFTGLKPEGYEHRYCFDSLILAMTRFCEMKCASEIPQGHVRHDL